ncbi:hypothetical protein QE439_003195 [Pedobacter agri]|nr:hypothetical protein [Pedobacter agri]
MLTKTDLQTLKSALIEKLGKQINNRANCEELSIDIFLKTNCYVSKESIMRLFGCIDDGNQNHPNIIVFLCNYANMKSDMDFNK